MKFQKQTLEQRVKDIRAECDKFVQARAEELKAGTGLPVEVILQMIRAKGCRCFTVLDICETQRRDDRNCSGAST